VNASRGADSLVGASSLHDPSVNLTRSGWIGGCSRISDGSSADRPLTLTSSGRPSLIPVAMYRAPSSTPLLNETDATPFSSFSAVWTSTSSPPSALRTPSWATRTSRTTVPALNLPRNVT
jgi:hypothetical protein